MLHQQQLKKNKDFLTTVITNIHWAIQEQGAMGDNSSLEETA
jgi:hypothetical protein